MTEEELQQLIKESPVVAFMVKSGMPVDRETYVALNTPEYDPDDLPPEVEAELPDVFKKERQETDEAES